MSLTRVKVEELPEEDMVILLGYLKTFLRWGESAYDAGEIGHFSMALIDMLARVIVLMDADGKDNAFELICADLKDAIEHGRGEVTQAVNAALQQAGKKRRAH